MQLLEYTFDMAAGHDIAHLSCLELTEGVTKEKGSCRYRITCLLSMEHVVEGHLKAEQHIGRIHSLAGPFPTPSRTKLSIHDPIYMDALESAVIELMTKENGAALAEGLGPVCSDLVAILPYHNGYEWEMRALFDFGQEGDRQGRSAHIWKINDLKYELEWV